jgi:hypothetical protein
MRTAAVHSIKGKDHFNEDDGASARDISRNRAELSLFSREMLRTTKGDEEKDEVNRLHV